ncbi:hypothetical protein IAR55_004551 [Kwoniella newhampshirensis]|uniref:Uncharacterized protein n=1 Tax=Kwoniella newhampshirensis TaxID=1651941 RepID=A0AAW0YXZ0_9TREE
MRQIWKICVRKDQVDKSSVSFCQSKSFADMSGLAHNGQPVSLFSGRSTQDMRSPPPPQPAFSRPPPLPSPSAQVTSHSAHAITSVTSTTVRSEPVSRNGNARPRSAGVSRFDDAEVGPHASLPAGAQAPHYVPSVKQADGRAMMSARRSNSATRRSPLAKVERSISASTPPMQTKPSQDFPHTPTAARPTQRRADSGTGQISEASAYAKAVAASLTPHKLEGASKSSTTSSPLTPASPSSRHFSRPLPATPNAASQKRVSPDANMQVSTSNKSGKSMVVGRTLSVKQATPDRQTPPAEAVSLHDKRMSSIPVNFDFPRSPTLPPLVDPRSGSKTPLDPVTKWGKDVVNHTGTPPLGSSQLPPRKSSVQGRRTVSSPLASPALKLNGKMSVTMSPTGTAGPFSPSRIRPRATLTFVLSHLQVQAALLPHLSINMFLSLTGASDKIRKRFTGEAVGRWIMKEWGMQMDREKGRTWPNLTVWEVESLLHDPATYSTYPAQWHNLLQHLCLSHTLIVLHLRQLPATFFPNPSPLPFDDEFAINAPALPFSNSLNSLSSQLPRSRMGSAAGSDSGSLAPSTKMPRQERLVEIIMPEPLAAQTTEEPKPFTIDNKPRRRGSISSLASAASMTFGRRRSNSTSTEGRASLSTGVAAAPIPSGKAALPPVSYPSAKRYAFKRHGEPTRSRTSSESGRPGSIFSVQSSPSLSQHHRMSSAYSSRGSFAVDRNAPPVPGFPNGLPIPPPIGGLGQRASFASSDAGRSSRRSDNGGNSPGGLIRRDANTPPPIRAEPAFDRPLPFVAGRVPILRVFVPLSDRVQRWPSAEGAAAAVRELEKCGALRRMKLGDLVVNTAIRQPKTTEHILIYVPFVRHLLVPLDYTFSPTGHLPVCLDAFSLAPSYYYPFLPAPQVIFLDLTPYADQAMQSLRLAFDRRDVTVASGARLSAKRYLHVAGFEIRPGDRAALEWQGMVSLEAEGTAEGRSDMERRLIGLGGAQPLMGPWEVVREKCMLGSIWLRLVRLQVQQ